jgi:hypothetical protein
VLIEFVPAGIVNDFDGPEVLTYFHLYVAPVAEVSHVIETGVVLPGNVEIVTPAVGVSKLKALRG